MEMKSRTLTGALLACALALLATSPAQAAEIKIGAGAAPTENVLKPVKDAFEKSSGISLQIISSGPKIALQDLDKGAVDAAAAGLSFDDWMALMKKEGAEVKDPAGLHQVVIGKDSIVVLVNKANPVTQLSKEQLKGIFTGSITNWKEVGGPDLPVIVVIGKLMPGTNSMFTKNMLDEAPMTKEVLEATTAEDVRQNVAANAEAIGIGPVAVIDASVKSPKTPELARPITLVTRGAPSPGVQKLLDFIKGDGQKLIVH
jgi:phosphate transport system substrate-binding protein